MFYNLYLSIKYNAHINVKIYVNVKVYKYIFKYVYKNNDYYFRIKQISENDMIKKMNEIQKYRDARWMNSIKIYWKIFGFKLHDHNFIIRRLSIHFSNQQIVTFDNDIRLFIVIDIVIEYQISLIIFFLLNKFHQQ